MVYTARKLCGKVSHVYGVAMDSCVFNFYCLVLVDEVDCSGLSSRYVADTTRPKKSGSEEIRIMDYCTDIERLDYGLPRTYSSISSYPMIDGQGRVLCSVALCFVFMLSARYPLVME